MNSFACLLFCSLFLIISTKHIGLNSSLNASIICPDAVSVCPSNCTCCISVDGNYSCCPLADGVCCADHKHCCPQHYKCDLKIFKCDRAFHATIHPIKLSSKKN